MEDTLLVFEQAGFFRLLILAVFVTATAVLSWLGIGSTGSLKKRLCLWFIRLTNLFVVGMLLLGPSMQHRELTRLKSRVVFIIDESQSMGVKSRGLRRMDRASRFFDEQRAVLDDIEKQHQVEIYAFSDHLRFLPTELIGRDTHGKHTDITSSLTELIEKERDPEHGIASVILISDGADTKIPTSVDSTKSLPVELRDMMKRLNAPVNTLLVEDDREHVDLAIAHVSAQEFAFIRNAMELEVTVESRGFRKDIEIPVTLEHNHRILASNKVRLPPDGSGKVTLRYIPDTVGKFAYRVRIPDLDNESNLENNRRGLMVTVIRDKIRVLHVVGRPSWDQRFLRERLKNDPNMDLVSFYILRNLSDTPGVREQELSLIPFPVNKLFGSEIATFDVVIFQNFDYAPYGIAKHFEKLADYVRAGGAFFMFGGDLSFGAGGYAHTPLAEILPVGLQAGDDLRLEEFHPVLSKGSTTHPVMKIGDQHDWSRLGSLGSYNQVKSIHPDTKVLLEHPFATVNDAPAPILALREVERGRSAAVLTDGIWRWAFRYPGKGGNPSFYSRFLGNMFRWLVRDPDFSPIMLHSLKSHYQYGETLQFQLKIQSMQPSTSESEQAIRLVVVDTDSGEVMHSRLVGPEEDQTIEFEGISLQTGAYAARLEFSGNQRLGKVEELFFVENRGPEVNNSSPRPILLKMIADFSGGDFSRLHDANLDKCQISPTDRYRVESSTTEPLVGQSWFLLALFLSLGFEWWLRKYWGYV